MNSFYRFSLTIAIKRDREREQEAVKRRIIVKIVTVANLTTLRIYCTYLIYLF